MNIYETTELIRTKLMDGNENESDLLFGINIEEDPYKNLSARVPFILIESDRTEFVNAEQGFIVTQDHYLALTCVVQAQSKEFTDYKGNVNQLVKNTIDKLSDITHENIQKIIPNELSHSELMIGSLKTSAVIITVIVKTYWEDI